MILMHFILTACIFLTPHPEDPQLQYKDRIKVMEVKYEGDLQDSTLTNFEVVVRYLLDSQESATMMIGFNNGGKVSQMSMLDDAIKIVQKGEGEVVLTVQSMVKDWGSKGDFLVHVNLSEDPLPKGRWQPLAGDRFVLIPEKW